MSRLTMATTSHPPACASKHKRRKYPRAQLLEFLEILGPLDTPLPPELPPSPPLSRLSSPLSGVKRKHEPEPEPVHNKKPRTTAAPDPPSRATPVPALPQARAPAPAPAYALRAEPTEDGEVREDVSLRLPFAASSSVPVRRPRRGASLQTAHFEKLFQVYHDQGRNLKYSASARLASTFSTSHPKYHPLANPPPSGSPYHKYGHLIARLEHLDALVCFTYAMWAKDRAQNSCSRENWNSMMAFLHTCRDVWRGEDTDQPDRAFLGLIFMIEGFIHMRKLRYSAHKINDENERLLQRLRVRYEADVAAKAHAAAAKAAQPTMLPSPAPSASSTPPSAQGTPNASSTSSSSAPLPAAPALPTQPERVPEMPDTITIPVGASVIGQRRSQSAGLLLAAHSMEQAQKLITLSVVAKHFPRTFARMVGSSLSAADEQEPEFGDAEDELFWPGQAVTGEGLGWVCLLGKAMIMEYGGRYGYRGSAGAIPRPPGEDGGMQSQAMAPTPEQR